MKRLVESTFPKTVVGIQQSAMAYEADNTWFESNNFA